MLLSNEKQFFADGDRNQEEVPKIEYSTVNPDTLPYSECFHQPCLQDSVCYSLSLGFFCECERGYTGELIFYVFFLLKPCTCMLHVIV